MLQPLYAQHNSQDLKLFFLVVTVCILVHIWLENTSASVHNRTNPFRIGPSLKGHLERLGVARPRRVSFGTVVRRACPNYPSRSQVVRVSDLLAGVDVFSTVIGPS